jgi:hypothetical protein
MCKNTTKNAKQNRQIEKQGTMKLAIVIGLHK